MVTAPIDYIIPAIAGRLGNQLFEIAHVYSKALKYKKAWYVYTPSMRYDGYDLTEHIFRNVPRIDQYVDNKNYNLDIPSNKKHTIYVGHYQSENHFKGHKQEVIDLFSCPLDVKEELLQKLPVLNSKNVTCISVRRGDYLNYPNYHPVVSAEYIKHSCSLITNTEHYIIASDDIDWCKDNLNLTNVTYLNGYQPHEQLWIMSLCHNFILSNSSFSWWGAYLSRNPNKIVICPNTWFGPDGPPNWDDIYCDGWTVIPTTHKDGKIVLL